MTKNKISLLVISAVLGCMLTIQFSSANRPKAESNAVADTMQLTVELAQQTERQQFLRSQIRALESQINSLGTQKGDQNQLLLTLAEELEKVKLAAGTNEVRGNGVIITIADNVNLIASGPVEMDLYRRSFGDFLYRLVNYLKGNEANAIVVNNHRIVSFSSIRSIDTNNLQVNTVMISPDKVIIKAVGNVEQMKLGMSLFPTYFEMMGKDFKVETVEDGSLVIPPYDDPVKYEYAKPEGDKKI